MSSSSSANYTEEWLVGPQSTKFYTRKYARSAHPSAVIVFVHGFAEHIGRYSHFHPRFLDHDLAVFAFDQRGYGRTGMDKEHKSPSSSYSKTSWDQQQLDIEWAIEHMKKAFPSVPIILMGHSMGGGESLGFATLPDGSAYSDAVKSLAGVITTSPLLLQTHPVSRLLRSIGGMASSLFPSQLIKASVTPGTLSHNPEVGKAYLADPYVKSSGSLRAVHDMLVLGEDLAFKRYSNWPKDLPLLVCHGDADQVASFRASADFVDKIRTAQKKHVPFQDGYHELQNEREEVQEKLLHTIVDFIKGILAANSGEGAAMSEADQI